ncbi:MAG TPA: GerMN domain-containing protein [Spirochaetota bacterium]|nr:GerMN domain-containing protein [Spirochaetota bacterium]
MKYHNFSQHYARIKRKKISGSRRKNKKQSGSFVYYLKFWLFIIIILISTYFYIRYKINHEPQSVFSKVSRIVEAEKDAVADTLSAEEKVKPEKTEQPAASEASAVKASNREVAIRVFFPQRKNKKIVMSFVKTSFEQGDSYYKNLIKKMLLYKNRNDLDRPFNIFNNGVKIRKAWLEEDVLLLDFNSRFSYNRYGYNGLRMQIQQVLWTVFKNQQENQEIKNISFLINGKRKSKIGGEGMQLKPFYNKKDIKKVIPYRNNV